MQALFCTGIAFLPRSMMSGCLILIGACVVWSTVGVLKKVIRSFRKKKMTKSLHILPHYHITSTIRTRVAYTPIISLAMYSTKSIHKNINPNFPQSYTSIGDPYSGSNDTLPQRWKEKQFVTQRFPKVSQFYEEPVEGHYTLLSSHLPSFSTITECG